MISLLSIVLNFVLLTGDPTWSCKLSHREPGVPATMLLYCTKTMPNGIEVVSVGKYVPDSPQQVSP